VYLKHGDISKVNALSLQETTDLWEGVKKSTHSNITLNLISLNYIQSMIRLFDSLLILVYGVDVFEVFWRVNEKLKAEKETTKNVPIRICRKERIILQEPTPVCDEQG